MNDLRRVILWLAALGILAVAVWGFHRDEVTGQRPGDPASHRFRLENRIDLFGYEYHLPLPRMLAAWGLILAVTAGLFPLATASRAHRWLGRWARRDSAPPSEGRG